jgi:Replication initiator protein, pSAM2
VDRAGHGYERWAELVAQAGYCHHPIRLAGRVDQADRQTGEIRQVYDSDREPDGVLLKACGTRRESRRLRRLFTTRPPAGQNTVLISHGFHLQGAAGLSVAEGESAIFSPGDAGGPSLVARITAEEWQSLAQQG